MIPSRAAKARYVDRESASEDWERIHRVADRHVDRLARAFKRGLERVRAATDLDELERTVTTGVLFAVEQLIAWDAFDPQVRKQVEAEVLNVDRGTADFYQRIVVEAAETQADVEGFAFDEIFNYVDQRAVRWAELHVAELVVAISGESRRTIRTIIARALRDGGHPRETAREIIHAIGLTERQGIALGNFRRALEEALAAGGKAPNRWSLAPGLRPRSAAHVDSLVRRYADRLLRHRAYTIARTETLTAANRGALETWRAASDRGLFDRALARRVWITTPDDRLCPRCAPLGGTTVGFEAPFRETVRGLPGQALVPVAGVTTMQPPLHPNCRCTTALVFA